MAQDDPAAAFFLVVPDPQQGAKLARQVEAAGFRVSGHAGNFAAARETPAAAQANGWLIDASGMEDEPVPPDDTLPPRLWLLPPASETAPAENLLSEPALRHPVDPLSLQTCLRLLASQRAPVAPAPQPAAPPPDRYQDLMEAINFGILVLDSECRISLVNRAAAAIWQLAPEQMLGKRLEAFEGALLDADEQPWPIGQLPSQAVLRNGRAVTDVLMGLRLAEPPPDGPALRWVMSNAFPDRDASGRLQGVIVSFVDITQHIETQRALRQAHANSQALQHNLAHREAQYHALMESVDFGLLVIDRDQRVSLANRAAAEIRGIPSSELVGLSISAFPGQPQDQAGKPLPPDQLPYWRVMATGEPVRNFVMGLVQEDPALAAVSRRWLMVSSYPDRNAEGQLLGVIVSFTDITQRREAERALQQAHEQLQQLHNELETRVHRRTVELSNLNSHLIQEVRQRKQVAAALRESEALYRNTLDVLGDGIILTQPTGSILLANPAACELFALKRPQLHNKALAELLADCVNADREPVPLAENPALAPLRDETPALGEVMGIRNAAGEWRWVQLSSRPVADPETGANVAVVLSFSDFTRRRAAEEALLHSYELLDAVFQHSADGLLVLRRADGLIQHCNTRSAKLLGYEQPRELVETSLDDLAITVLESGHTHVPLEDARAQEDWFGEMELVCADGSSFWANVSMAPIQLDEEHLSYVRITDITSQKSAQRQMRRLQSAIAAAHDPILLLRGEASPEELEIVYTNPAFHRAIGYPPEDVLYRPLGMLRLDETAPETAELLRNALREREPINFEANMARRQGEPFIANLYFSPVGRDEESREELPKDTWVLIVRDVTERRRIEQELAAEKLAQQNRVTKAVLDAQENERQRVAEELHDGLGHNLSVLKMKFSMLRAHLSEPAAAETAELYQSTIHLLDETTQEVRNISRDLQPNLLREFGLVKALGNLINRFNSRGNEQPALQFQPFNLREDGYGETTEITFYRIAQELISNAIKYARATKVTLQVSEQEGYLLLVYEDDGQGFDPSLLESRGMGLRNMEARARLLSGYFSLDSRPGHGTNAVVEAPLNEAAAADQPPDSSRSQASSA